MTIAAIGQVLSAIGACLSIPTCIIWWWIAYDLGKRVRDLEVRVTATEEIADIDAEVLDEKGDSNE